MVRGRWIRWMLGAALTFLIVYLFVLALKHLNENPAIGRALLNPKWKDISETIAVILCVIAGLLIPNLKWKRLRAAESAFARFANNRIQAIVFAGLLPMLLRLALLPVLPVPQPLVADEFGYLLLADTFASGRITNPVHPMWKHFETIYVLHQPSYTSIYPVAPALLMTIPKLAGATPWLGVWCGVGLMCALICWALQGWMPPKWALIGALLAVCRFSITSSWMNSYWGGAVAAIGGALVLGALPRILRRRHMLRNTLLFGLGLAVLAQSRPYEGFLLSVPLVAGLTIWLLKKKGAPVRARINQVALPLCAVMAALIVGTAYYNWRVTGDPMLMPYGSHQKIYGTPQSFYWQPPIQDAPGIHRYKDIADVYRWQLQAYKAKFSWAVLTNRLQDFWRFYLQPLLTLPLLFAPLIFRHRRGWVLLAAAIAVLAGNGMYPFFFPHYVAPLCALLMLLVVEGLRRMRTLRLGGRPVGAFVSRSIILLVPVSALATLIGGFLQPLAVTAAVTPRSLALRQLKEQGGKHLVLVRYSPEHVFHYGVVFNDADIDRSPVVWARELDPASNQALLNYFWDRDVWVFNTDQDPAALARFPGRPVRFPGKPYITVLANGGGKRDDRNDGVSPGSIAIVLGGNFGHRIQGSTNPRSILGPLHAQLAGVSAAFGALFEPSIDAPERTAPLPLQVDGISVQFNKTFAPIFCISNFDGQDAVTVQVPFDLPLGTVSMKLRVDDTILVKKVRGLPATPGILQWKASDSKHPAVILRPDGSIVDQKHPARRGEILRLFATGLGPMTPAVPTNQPGSSPPGPRAFYPITVGVNHRGVPVVSVAYAAGLIGIQDLAFQIPAEAPSGPDVPLSMGVMLDGRAVFGNTTSLPIK